MIAAIFSPVKFADFLEWCPENGRYELINGCVVETQPTGKHEEVTDFLGISVIVESQRRYIRFPKQPTFTVYQLVDGEYQVQQFRGNERIISPTFPELNLTAEQVFNAGESVT